MKPSSIQFTLLAVLILLYCFVQADAWAEDLCERNIQHTFTHDAETREYEIYLPKGFHRSKQYPVILLLHGGGGSARGMCVSAQYHSVADLEEFIVVYPQGSEKKIGLKKIHVWNSGECGEIHIDADGDDVGYFKKLLLDLQARYPVDPKRISAAGLSNGGMMTYRLACELSTQIAAIVPVGAPGSEVCKCKAKRVVPTFFVHGTDDPCAALDGGPCNSCFQSFFRRLSFGGADVTRECPSARGYFDRWRKAFGSEEPLEATSLSKGVECRSTAKGEFQQCIFKGGHVWPTPYSLHGPMCSSGPEGRKRACRIFTEIVGEFPKSFDINYELTRFVKNFRVP